MYAQQIEKSKIREIRLEVKRSMFYESSHAKPNRRFYDQYSSMGNKDKVSNQNSKGGGHSFERPKCTSCGKKHLGKCLARMDVCFACGSKVQNLRVPNINSKVKGVNQSPLDPNAPKKNPLYGVGVRRGELIWI